MQKFLKRMRAVLLSPLQANLELQAQIHAESLKRQILKDTKYDDPKRLERCGFKAYSQTDEDGILEEIFRRIGIRHSTFVEFGVGPGTENNSLYLLFKGWRGLWIEADADYYQILCRNFGEVMGENRLVVRNDFVSPGNINDLISGAGFKGEIDLLSVDIDGNDYYVLDKIACVSPRVVILEYNAKLRPPVNWVMPFNEKHMWDGSDRFGASLSAYESLMRGKGYRLVGTNVYGLNAFFVRSDLAADKFPADSSPENLYNSARYYLTSFTKSGHYPFKGGILG